MTPRPARNARSVVYATTIGFSAFTLLRGQLAWLREQGWDVTLVASPDDLAQAAARREGVAFHPLAMRRDPAPVADLAALAAWVRFLAAARPAVVNVGTPKAGLLGILAAWLTGVPRRVYLVRGLRLEGASGPLAAALACAERLCGLLATDVVAVSPSLGRELLRRRLVSPGKLWTIGDGSSNGIDVAAVQARIAGVDRDALRRELGLRPDDFVVGFVGRVTRDKGIHTLLDAFASAELTPRARLLVVGPTEEEGFETGFAALGDRLARVPWTDDVWGHLPALDVLSLPTLREGFGTVVLEAAAAGIPAIVTTATGAVDTVVDQETGLLMGVGDAAALVRHINALADDPEGAGRLGRAARERARERFAQERIWTGMQDVMTGAGASRVGAPEAARAAVGGAA
ncbi:glycosyltransferase family 4 protein [Propioniciclava coleopterorum]|uniref:Glycosyltransferase family 4 protein n=1 Tax=Propioniciclava coleopterorum TaxID=2714937 RepID=A0A6G7Y3J2_9ACTN|nr:glycosyltransferase [Propioniciclava coleopterorum]QIK71385.1 glycosyltransferase family 4 protein [Propioniciclava coleopterorum]